MKSTAETALTQERITKVVLALVYLGVFAFFAYKVVQRFQGGLSFAPFDLLLLGFAVMRTGRMISYDRILEPFRAPFTCTVLDYSSVGKTVVAKGTGVQRAIGQMIACPVCIGTWVAAALVYTLLYFPGPTRLFLYILAATGIAELLHALVEAFAWKGVLNRTQTGEIMLGRKENKEG